MSNKYLLLLLLIPLSLHANCPLEDIGIRCTTAPCLAVIDHSIGITAVATCSKVYIKSNGKWRFDHYSIIQNSAMKIKDQVTMGMNEVKIMELK